MKLRQKNIEEFLQELRRRGLLTLTIERRAFDLKCFKNFLRARRLSVKTARAFIDNRLKKGDSSNSIASIVSSLRQFTKFLFEEKIINEEIFQYLHAVRVQSLARPRVPSVEEVMAIVNCPRGWGKYHKWIDRRRYDLLFLLLALHALRISEALKLRVRDFNFADSTFTFIRKGGDFDTLGIDSNFGRKLCEWISDKNFNADDWVFQTNHGKKPQYSTFREELKKRVKILGLDSRIGMHDFRRSWCSNAARANINTVRSMQVAGHKSFATHLKYIKLTPRESGETINMHPTSKAYANSIFEILWQKIHAKPLLFHPDVIGYKLISDYERMPLLILSISYSMSLRCLSSLFISSTKLLITRISLLISTC